MKRRFATLLIAALVASGAPLFAQDGSLFSTPEPTAAPAEPSATPEASVIVPPPPAPVLPQPTPQKRGWMSHVLHPFSGGKPRQPEASNPQVRGMTVELLLSPQTVKLSEVRQLSVLVTLTNKSKKPVTLEFPSEQRIDIQLMNSSDIVLTKWSDNHAFKDKPATVLINPDEHVEYKESIATRELSPDKVYTVEVFFPKYPDLRTRQKFLTAP